MATTFPTGSNSVIWTTETPPQFPVPHPEDQKGDNSDPWANLHKEKKAEVDSRSEIWKDEIQNLLTFTGLFSAVVAGFLAATYSSLSVGPVDVNTFVLAQVALRLDVSIGLANASSVPPLSLDLPFVPPPSLVRVHIFWFLSLALSLSTAAISIVCLQWIREYQRPPAILQGKKAFVIFSMRTESFDRWHIPTIIALLPFAISVALILFFVGLIDFLLPLGNKIAVPTVVVISGTLLFLICTTLAPAFQAHLYLRFDENGTHTKAPAYPCPYRSPQAWRLYLTALIVAKVVMLVIVTAFCIMLLVAQLVCFAVLLPICAPCMGFDRARELVGFMNQGFTLLDFWVAIPKLVNLIRGFARHDWYLSDLGWVDFEHPTLGSSPTIALLGRKQTTPNGLGLRREWRYAIQGLATISTFDAEQAHTIYDCIQSIPMTVSNSTNSFPDPGGIISLLSDASNANLWDRRVLRSWRDPPAALRHAEYQVLALNTFPGTHTSSFGHALAMHQLELYIRILGGIFAGIQDQPAGSWMERARDTPGFNDDTFVPRLLRSGSRELLASIPGGDRCIEQLVFIFSKYITNLLDRNPAPTLGQFHRRSDIFSLLFFVLPPFSALLKTTVDKGAPLDPASPLYNILETFSHTHHLLSSYLNISLLNTRGAVRKHDAPFALVMFSVYQYLVFALKEHWHPFGAPSTPIPWSALQKWGMDASGTTAPVVEEYISSFKTLLWLVDAILLTVHPNRIGLRDFEAFSPDHRRDVLHDFGLERVDPPREQEVLSVTKDSKPHASISTGPLTSTSSPNEPQKTIDPGLPSSVLEGDMPMQDDNTSLPPPSTAAPGDARIPAWTHPLPSRAILVPTSRPSGSAKPPDNPRDALIDIGNPVTMEPESRESDDLVVNFGRARSGSGELVVRGMTKD